MTDMFYNALDYVTTAYDYEPCSSTEFAWDGEDEVVGFICPHCGRMLYKVYDDEYTDNWMKCRHCGRAFEEDE